MCYPPRGVQPPQSCVAVQGCPTPVWWRTAWRPRACCPWPWGGCAPRESRGPRCRLQGFSNRVQVLTTLQKACQPCVRMPQGGIDTDGMNSSPPFSCLEVGCRTLASPILRERYGTPTDTSWPQAACWGSGAGVGGAARTVHIPGRWRSIAGARGTAPSPACRFQRCHCWRDAACVLTFNISTACSQTSRSGWEFGAITLRHSKSLLGSRFRVSGNNRHALTRKNTAAVQFAATCTQAINLQAHVFANNQRQNVPRTCGLPSRIFCGSEKCRLFHYSSVLLRNPYLRGV